MASCSCLNITHNSWDFTTPANLKVKDATVDNLNDKKVKDVHKSIVDSKDKSQACSLKGLLKDMESSPFVQQSAAEQNVIKELRKPLCEIIGEEEETVVQNGSGGGSDTAPEPEVIYGCLDPEATNYYCKENDCVDNQPPEGVVDINCEYEQELAVENKYLFCNGKYGCFGAEDTTEEGWISPTTDIAKWINNGAIENDHIYDVKKGVKDLIKNIKPTGIFLKNQKGFYTRKFSEQLINEFANALTVAIFKTKFKKDSDRTFPFTRLTVYGGDSQPLGQFSIIPTTDKNGEVDSISSIKMHDSSRTLNARLRDEIGTEILDPNHEAGMIKLFGPGGRFEDVKFTVKDGKIINEQVKEGLGLVLQEEPIGLSKLLK